MNKRLSFAALALLLTSVGCNSRQENPTPKSDAPELEAGAKLGPGNKTPDDSEPSFEEPEVPGAAADDEQPAQDGDSEAADPQAEEDADQDAEEIE